MNQITVATINTGSLEKQSTITQALWIAGFAVMTAVGAQIEIPHQPIPYTLQTFFVLLSGALLGKRNGALSQCVYILFGILGVPVFSGFGFGLARILGPAGGYLLSFPVAAFIVGYLINQRTSFLWSLLSMMIGLFAVFSLGTLQLNFVYYHDWTQAFSNGFLIFSWWDCLKLGGAATIATVVLRQRHKGPR